jgi:radical SAM-linked protein
MARLLFEKKGNAIWISHLDLMRLFQRAFKRAGLPLTHTQGYNPRPSVSIALPLSVGIESGCELLDFDLDGDAKFSCDEIKKRLNDALVAGVRVLDVYEGGRKIRDLSLLSCQVILEYDACIPDGCEDAIRELFGRETLLVSKKSKNGPTEQDIVPMIKELSAQVKDANTVVLDAIICCQNPSLSPMQLAAAIEKYLPDFKPDFAKSSRIELFDAERKIFR